MRSELCRRQWLYGSSEVGKSIAKGSDAQGKGRLDMYSENFQVWVELAALWNPISSWKAPWIP